jgi:hypothetical protein
MEGNWQHDPVLFLRVRPCNCGISLCVDIYLYSIICFNIIVLLYHEYKSYLSLRKRFGFKTFKTYIRERNTVLQTICLYFRVYMLTCTITSNILPKMYLSRRLNKESIKYTMQIKFTLTIKYLYHMGFSMSISVFNTLIIKIRPPTFPEIQYIFELDQSIFNKVYERNSL